MNSKVFEIGGPITNFLDSIEELQNAIDFYTLLDSADKSSFFKLLFKTPFEDRRDIYLKFRASFSISDEEISRIRNMIEKKASTMQPIRTKNDYLNALARINEIKEAKLGTQEYAELHILRNIIEDFLKHYRND